MKKSTLGYWIMGVVIIMLLISNSYYKSLATNNQKKADENYQTFKDAQRASSNKYTECLSKLAGKIVIPTSPDKSITENKQTILEQDTKISDYAAAYEGARTKYNTLVNTHNDLVVKYNAVLADRKKCEEGWGGCVSSTTTVSKDSDECANDYNSLLTKYNASVESNKECVAGWNNETKNFQDLSALCKNMLQKNITQ